MTQVEINGKKFEEMIPEDELEISISKVADQLNADYAGKDPLLIGILNGSFLFAADLVRYLDWDPEIQFMRLSSYQGGMTTSGRMRILLDLEDSVEQKDILIIEDIVDTGNTTEWLRNYLLSKGATSVKVVTLLFKKEAFKAESRPEYICFDIPNKFVVGYGMDFGERGRHLPAVYQLAE